VDLGSIKPDEFSKVIAADSERFAKVLPKSTN